MEEDTKIVRVIMSAVQNAEIQNGAVGVVTVNSRIVGLVKPISPPIRIVRPVTNSRIREALREAEINA